MSLIDLFKQHQEFAQKKFPESTWESSLEGLKEEIKEVKFAQDDCKVIDGKESRNALGLEYMDCLMYLLDSMKRSGFEASEIPLLFKQKLDINLKRDWVKNDDNTYSHVKTTKGIIDEARSKTKPFDPDKKTVFDY